MSTFQTNEGDIFLERGRIGVFLIHGFFQSPEEFSQIANQLAENNITVYCPCLPSYSNHKNTPLIEFFKIDISSWQKEAEKAFLNFQKVVEKVYVGGNSLGANLTILLASQYPVEGVISLGGAIYLSPALRFAQKIGPVIVRLLVNEDSVPFFQVNPNVSIIEMTKLFIDTKVALPNVKAPILIIHSKHDKMVLPKSAKYIYKKVSSKDKKLVFAANRQKNGHGLACKDFNNQVSEEILKFIPHS